VNAWSVADMLTCTALVFIALVAALALWRLPP